MTNVILKRGKRLPDGTIHRFNFTPSRHNPAHATLYNSGLSIYEALATLANREGRLFPLPDPIPEPYEP